MKERFNNPNEIKKKEVKVMKNVQNENSVKFIELIESNNYFYIIMEYCEFNYISLNLKRNTPLSINEIK